MSTVNLVELLIVEDCFLIEGRGLVVIPDFSVPYGWKDRTDVATVVRPNGEKYEVNAQFSLSHYRLIDSNAPIDKRWRVVMLLLSREKEELPRGSRILVSLEIRDALLRTNVG